MTWALLGTKDYLPIQLEGNIYIIEVTVGKRFTRMSALDTGTIDENAYLVAVCEHFWGERGDLLRGGDIGCVYPCLAAELLDGFFGCRHHCIALESISHFIFRKEGNIPEPR